MDLTLPAVTKDRADVTRAFIHLANLNREMPPEGADMMAFMRDKVDRYGLAEPIAPITGVGVQPVSADGIPAEWLLPDGWRTGPNGHLVYLHGGAWAGGSLNSHRPMASTLAKHLGYPVSLVDYSLAPERPFPAALDDCATALAWARLNGPDGEGATNHLCLAGDSAGGNIAAAITVKGIEQGGEVPDRLALLSGSLELSHQAGRSKIADPLNDFALQEMAFAGIHALYIQGKTTPGDPLISPMQASDETLASFPPTLLQASNCEFLLWDAEEFARKLTANSVRVNLSVWPGLPHVWQIFPFLPESAQALSEAAAFLAPDG